ncbi:hypothetical protein D3C73_687560 [compost metagenome]
MRFGLRRFVRQPRNRQRAGCGGRSRTLAAQTEQSVLIGGQGEARQGHRVDLLLSHFRGKLCVDEDRCRVAAAGAGVCLGLTRPNVGIKRSHHTVVERLTGIESGVATSLNDRGEGLIAIGDGAVLRKQHAHPSQEGAQVRRKRGRWVGVVSSVENVRQGGGIASLVDEAPVPANGVDLLVLQPLVFDGGGIDLEVTGGRDGAAGVGQCLCVDQQVRAAAQAGRSTAFGDLQAIGFIDFPKAIDTTTAASITASPRNLLRRSWRSRIRSVSPGVGAALT